MKKTLVKKILASSLISILSIQMIYVIVEPTVVVAATASDNVVVTLTVDAGITITTPTDITMPAITTSVNGSVGTILWNVKTNNTAGYDLFVKASTSPAMKNGTSSFADYTETSSTVPETWSTSSPSTEFGYSAFGTDVLAAFGTGASCGSSTVPLNTLKWLGFKTTDYTVATKSTYTTGSGIDTTVCVAAEQKGVYAASGAYTATLTATATTK